LHLSRLSFDLKTTTPVLFLDPAAGTAAIKASADSTKCQMGALE
jgi:hypothetical protein